MIANLTDNFQKGEFRPNQTLERVRISRRGRYTDYTKGFDLLSNAVISADGKYVAILVEEGRHYTDPAGYIQKNKLFILNVNSGETTGRISTGDFDDAVKRLPGLEDSVYVVGTYQNNFIVCRRGERGILDKFGIVDPTNEKLVPIEPPVGTVSAVQTETGIRIVTGKKGQEVSYELPLKVISGIKSGAVKPAEVKAQWEVVNK